MKNIMFLLITVLLLAITGCVSETDSELHDHSVEIEGKDMKLLSVEEVAYLWEIDSQVLLDAIILEFDLQGNYSVDSILDDIRLEYPFSPAVIKNLAEDIKLRDVTNE